ncbi:unnamed protein product [Nesidiocoris tenuis]|uniref:Uncharacterized protein n=1 Tax=Nesidiocoris tenuis TaxID=355587 RepID=A0A6H5GNN2_9HEMI|nr:unnamed protein product [Nesidiocoris tenuis]
MRYSRGWIEPAIRGGGNVRVPGGDVIFINHGHFRHPRRTVVSAGPGAEAVVKHEHPPTRPRLIFPLSGCGGPTN